MAKTAQVKNNKSKKFHLSKNVSLAFEFIGIGVIIIAIVLVITGGGGFDFNLGFGSKEKNAGLNTDEIVSKAKSGMSYEDAKTSYPTSIFNPNITNVDQNTFSDDNKNVLIVFNGNNIDLTEINIKQGDIVTWQNKSNKAVKVVGDNWGSTNVLRNNTSFSQQFDFLGNYAYEIVEVDDDTLSSGIEGARIGDSNGASGVIVVIK